MEKIKIWVDDLRPVPSGYIGFKTVNETIDFLSKSDPSLVAVLDLDHDAGDYYPQGGDYIKILDWLEYKQISIPISIHSGNSVGIKNMMRIIAKNGWTYVPTEDEIACGLFF